VLTSEQIDLVKQSVESIYKRHVTDLVETFKWVNKYNPQKNDAIGELCEGFLIDTHVAIKSYGENLVSDIIGSMPFRVELDFICGDEAGPMGAVAS
jgi:hypothetical protein